MQNNSLTIFYTGFFMADISLEQLLNFVTRAVKRHPWHGIPPTPEAGSNFSTVNAFIEIVPSDTVKYEIDKESGYLSIDRPHKLSNMMPCLYGFVPQTFCDENVASKSRSILNNQSIVGDGDPLDICVLTERQITHGDILLQAKVIGGFRMLDGGEADDKIIAVLKDDHLYGGFSDVKDVPEAVIARLKHYFLTYKEVPTAGAKPKVEITHTYGHLEAVEVCKLAFKDYQVKYGVNPLLG
jgi:inorganic pyrophosphatase